MKRSIAISQAGGHAHMTYLRIVNRVNPANISSITEDQKQKFLKCKTHECKHQKARVSIESCRRNIERAMRRKQSYDILYDNDKFLKCLDCKYAKKLEAKPEPKVNNRKPCKCFAEFGDLCQTSDKGGWCNEKTVIHGAYAKGHFNNKLFCSQRCCANYHHLKQAGTLKTDGKMYFWKDRNIK
jgi:hypothetical protein